MRRLLRLLAAGPHPGGLASGAWGPSFPMIEGGTLTFPDLAAALATMACYNRSPSDARHP